MYRTFPDFKIGVAKIKEKTDGALRPKVMYRRFKRKFHEKSPLTLSRHVGDVRDFLPSVQLPPSGGRDRCQSEGSF
jgi:hypothetical protein